MNWINTKEKEVISNIDKIKILLKQPYKLVLVQQHELERLRLKPTLKTYDIDYINNLYTHYIINGLNKTYLSH